MQRRLKGCTCVARARIRAEASPARQATTPRAPSSATGCSAISTGIFLPNREARMVAEITRKAERIIRCEYPDVEIPDVSIPEFVLGHAAERGEKVAIIDGGTGRTLTYAQVVDQVRRVAAGLAA